MTSTMDPAGDVVRQVERATRVPGSATYVPEIAKLARPAMEGITLLSKSFDPARNFPAFDPSAMVAALDVKSVLDGLAYIRAESGIETISRQLADMFRDHRSSPLTAIFDQLQLHEAIIPRALAAIAATGVGDRTTASWFSEHAIQLSGAVGLEAIRPDFAAQFSALADLTVRRTLLAEPTPMARHVDRLARSWTSVGDQVLTGHPQPTLLDPLSVLATGASILDLAASTDEFTQEDREYHDQQVIRRDYVADWLGTLSSTVQDHWLGMWSRMQRRDPDWQAHAAASAVELVAKLLDCLAPDQEVTSWQVGTGLYSNEYLERGKKGPNRRLKLRYLAVRLNVRKRTVDDLFMSIPDTLNASTRCRR